MSKYIDSEELKAEIERLKKKYATKENDAGGEYLDEDMYFYQGKRKACQEILSFIDSLQQEQPEVDLVEEITDKSRACCNCINGITQYPNCYCWQHKDCNTDEPYKISKEDWVKTAKTCKEFELG